MNTQANERHPAFHHSGAWHHAASIGLGALLAMLLASSAHVYAASSSQAMDTTNRAPSDIAIPRNKKPQPQARQPKQAHPGRYYEVSHAPSSAIEPVTHKPPHTYTAKQRSLHAPTGPGPMHAGAGAATNANSHGIIFVGGHAQPLQPGAKQSLNPQPIPPGHTVRHAQPPGAPVEHIRH